MRGDFLVGLHEGPKIKETLELRDPFPNVNPPRFGTIRKVKSNVGLVSFYFMFDTG